MEETSVETMQSLLERQRQAYLDEGVVSASVRKDRLARAVSLIAEHEAALVEALSADFGHRSRHQSLLTDIAASIAPLRHAEKHVARWMRPGKNAKPDRSR